MSKESSHLREAITTIRHPTRLRNALPDRSDPAWYVLGLSLTLFVGFSAYLSVLYQGYVLTGADFGSYVHMFATTLAGEGWLLQGKYVASHPGGSYWGGHFSLTLLLFYPLYALVPSPYTLIVAKSAVLAASVLVCWALARDSLDSDRLAGLVTISYALNPFLWSAWLFHFQEQILLPLFVFGAYYAYARERRLAFLGLFALALVTNEFVVILGIGFLCGLVVAAYRGDRLRSELPTLVGAGVLTVAAQILASRVIARFSTLSGIPPASIAPPLHSHVDGARASIGELVGVLLANPALVVETLSIDSFEKFALLVAFSAPVLFLALTDEVTLGALAPYLAFAWVFAGRGVYYSFNAHYPLYLLPFVYIGTIRVLARLERSEGRLLPVASDGDRTPIPSLDSLRQFTRSSLGRVLAVVLVLHLLGGAMVVTGQGTPVTPGGDRDALREQAFDLVPANASLLTQNDLYPHVATRPNATFIPVESTFEYYRRQYGTPTPTYILFDTTTGWSEPIVEIYGDRLGDDYGLYAYQDGIWLYKRGYTGSPRAITTDAPPSLVYQPSELALAEGELRDGRIVASGGSSGQAVWYGPYATLPAGSYTVTYRMNVTSGGERPVVTVDATAGEENRRVLAGRTVRATDGTANVTISFTLDEAGSAVEFRGRLAGGDGTISLESVTVTPRNNSTTTDRARISRSETPTSATAPTNPITPTNALVSSEPTAERPDPRAVSWRNRR